jgi:hypothetical protein
MAAGTAAAMVLLPGAASAQVVHSVQQQLAGTPGDPSVPPGDPVVPPKPKGPAVPQAPELPKLPSLPIDPGNLGTPNLTGSHDDHPGDHHHGDDGRHDDGKYFKEPGPPDHASGEVARVDLLKSRLLDITKYDATIENNGEAHSEATVLGLGGGRIIGSSASSRDHDHNRSGENHDLLKLCDATGGALCLSLLYSNAVAEEDGSHSLAAARAGVLALCLGGHDKNTTASYECNGLGLGVAEGLGIAERDKKENHTKADSANELLNLCLGQREKLTEPCQGLGVQLVHADSRSRSDKPDTERHSFLIGIDSNGKSSYLADESSDAAFPKDCGDSAVLCLLLNQGKSVIYRNPKEQGAGSAVEVLRLDVLNRLLLVVLGQAETFAHETNEEHGHGGKGEEHGKGEEQGKGEEHGKGEEQAKGPELAQTGADIAPMLAGGFLLTGLGALTMAATRRRPGRHSL